MTEPEAPSKPPIALAWEDYLPRVGQEGIPQWRREQLAKELWADEQRQRMRMSPAPAQPPWKPTEADIERLFRTALGKAAGDVSLAAGLLQAWRNDSLNAATLDHAMRQLLAQELTRISKTKPPRSK